MKAQVADGVGYILFYATLFGITFLRRLKFPWTLFDSLILTHQLRALCSFKYQYNKIVH